MGVGIRKTQKEAGWSKSMTSNRGHEQGVGGGDYRGGGENILGEKKDK